MLTEQADTAARGTTGCTCSHMAPHKLATPTGRSDALRLRTKPTKRSRDSAVDGHLRGRAESAVSARARPLAARVCWAR